MIWTDVDGFLFNRAKTHWIRRKQQQRLPTVTTTFFAVSHSSSVVLVGGTGIWFKADRLNVYHLAVAATWITHANIQQRFRVHRQIHSRFRILLERTFLDLSSVSLFLPAAAQCNPWVWYYPLTWVERRAGRFILVPSQVINSNRCDQESHKSSNRRNISSFRRYLWSGTSKRFPPPSGRLGNDLMAKLIYWTARCECSSTTHYYCNARSSPINLCRIASKMYICICGCLWKLFQDVFTRMG